MEKSMFDIIKKQNGEHFAKTVRNYDNGIFEVKNLDKILKYAGREAGALLPYLESLKDIQIEEMSVHQDPITLLNKAGYDAYVADSLKKQNAIRKYFAPGEELCTFSDRNRFMNYYIINAVRKDVDKIKREDFIKPSREDRYGTSVISIQVLKTGGFISIKNRYNHTVVNPDNTFQSNPDNIILGLSDAIKHYFHVDFSSQKAVLPNNFVNINGQIVKFNHENNNIYVGDDIYVRDGQIYEIDKNSEILLDTILYNAKKQSFRDITIDFFDEDLLQNHNFRNTSSYPYGYNALVYVLNDLAKGKKVSVRKKPDGTRTFAIDTEDIAVLDGGKILELNLPGVNYIGNVPMTFGQYVYKLNLPDVESLPDYFLYDNKDLKELSVPKLKDMGARCFFSNRFLKSLDLPNVEIMGEKCFYNNSVFEYINASKLKRIGQACFFRANCNELEFPNLESMGDYCFHYATGTSVLKVPKLTYIGNSCFSFNKRLTELYAPDLEVMGGECFFYTNELEKISLPKLQEMGYSCFYHNKKCNELDLPALKKMGKDCFERNEVISKVNMPKLEKMGENCFENNLKLQNLNLPELQEMGCSCFYHNKKLTDINLPRLMKIEDCCFAENKLVPNNWGPLKDGLVIKSEKTGTTQTFKAAKDNLKSKTPIINMGKDYDR